MLLYMIYIPLRSFVSAPGVSEAACCLMLQLATETILLVYNFSFMGRVLTRDAKTLSHSKRSHQGRSEVYPDARCLAASRTDGRTVASQFEGAVNAATVSRARN